MQILQNRYGKIGLVLLIACIISAFLLWTFEDRFDSDTWKSEPTERYKMVDNLIEQQLLIGKTKQETISLLGQPNSKVSNNKNAFVYEIGKQPSFFKNKQEHLLIIFIINKVDEVTLAYE